MPKGNCPWEDFCSFKRLFLDGSSAAEREPGRILIALYGSADLL